MIVAKENGNAVVDEDMTIVKIAVKQVSFSGVGAFQELKSDTGSAYTAPHWEDGNDDGKAVHGTGGDKLVPVALVAAQQPTVVTVFKVEPNGAIPGTQIKAKGTFEGKDFPAMETAIGASLTLTEKLPLLANKVQTYDASTGTGGLQIEWKIKLAQNGQLQNIGTSCHTAYVVAKKPITTAITNNFETVYYQACKSGGSLTSSSADADIAKAVWKSFTGLVVNTVVPTKPISKVVWGQVWGGGGMTYWGNPALKSFDTPNLLSNSDGKCGAWSRFFIDCLRAHGVDGVIQSQWAPPIPNSEVLTAVAKFFPKPLLASSQTISVTRSPASLLLINNWNILYTSFRAKLPYPPNPYILYDGDMTGVSAQGPIADPSCIFSDHAFVGVGANYYDPSYGRTPPASVLDWEDKSVTAFATWVQVDATRTYSISLFGKTFTKTTTKTIFNGLYCRKNSPGLDSVTAPPGSPWNPPY